MNSPDYILSSGPPPAPTHRRHRAALIAVAIIGLVALGVGCGKNASTASTDATASTAKTAGTAPTSTTSTGSSGTAAPPATGSTTPATVCTSAPASTSVNPKQGGGEIVCGPVGGGSSDPGSSTGSPPMTDTTLGPIDSAVPKPDATHGVVQVSATGGYECDSDPCPAIGIIMKGTITLTNDAGGATTVQTISATGTANFVVGAGRYNVTAQADNGSCVAQPIDVTVNATATVALDCSVPYEK